MHWLSSRTFWRLFALTWLAGACSTQAITADDPCPICGQRYGETIYSFTRHGREQKVLVCGACAKLETTCYICSVPVKDKFLRLADGRLLCEDDAKEAVLLQDKAESLFDDVKRDVQSMLSGLGTLPHHNIHLTLEAKAHLDKTGANLISAHDDRLLMGLTRSSSIAQGVFEHSIHLLYGLTRERMMVVSAHEYAHAWLHENVRRKMNHDTVEGFCDWMAYKIITQKNSPYETKVLLESKYSEGQLQAFVAAEKEHSFYHVMQWVKHGVDPELDPEQLERILVLRPTGATPVAQTEWPVYAVTPRPAATNLVLKGLSGSVARRFALINDATFQTNEQGKVRLGDSNVVVRCVEILKDAVVIQVAGETGPRTLKLSQSDK